MTKPFLDIQNLYLIEKNSSSEKNLLTNISFSLKQGETLAIIGGNKNGKTLLALSLLGFYNKKDHTLKGSIYYQGKDLLKENKKKQQQIRFKDIGFLPENTQQALNPLLKIKDLIKDFIAPYGKISQHTLWIEELLNRLKLPSAILNQYPHQLSGGMKTRVSILLSLVKKPKLLIADNPFFTLDPPLEKEMLELLKDLQKSLNLSLIITAHNSYQIESIASHFLTLEKGKMTQNNRLNPQFQLKTESQKILTPTEKKEPLFKELYRLEQVSKTFNLKNQSLNVLKEISLTLYEKEGVAIVGKSGSGKSTLGNILLKLSNPTTGNVFYKNQNFASFKPQELKNFHQKNTLLFQGSASSVNPYHKGLDILKEGLRIHGKNPPDSSLLKILSQLDLPSSILEKTASQLSLIEKQLLCLGRLLLLSPQFVIYDEVLNYLDSSKQSYIAKLIEEITKDYQITNIFITHHITKIENLVQRVLFLENGIIKEDTRI